jgi:hypothetical protein
MPNSWVQDIVSAFENLGGKAKYRELYEEVSRIRGNSLPQSWQAIIRQSVESHSSDSRNFKGNDLFYSVGGIGSGHWGLRDSVLRTPPAKDLEEPKETRRRRIATYRILRETSLTRTIKALHENRCQMKKASIGALVKKKVHSFREGYRKLHVRPVGASPLSQHGRILSRLSRPQPSTPGRPQKDLQRPVCALGAQSPAPPGSWFP